MLRNRYNFLRWDDGDAATTVEGDLPTGYVRDSERCDYRPLVEINEPMRFHINVPEGIDDIIAVGNTLALVTPAGSIVNLSIATLQEHEFLIDAGTAKTYYAEVTITGAVPVGNYKYQIMGSDGETVLLTSNQFTVVAASGSHRNYSALVKFRHDRYFYGTNYQDLSTFYQQYRLHFNEIDSQFENEKEVYDAVTTGKQRQYNNFMKEVYTIEAYYFDRLAHEAAGVMFDCDEIYINLKRYTSKGAYKKNTDERGKIFKGSIDCYKEEFATVNRCND